MNDPIKTSITLLFIRHALACVPIVDLTKRGSGNGGVGYMEVDNAEGVNLEEEDEECRLGTAVFEDFVGKFLERIFVMVSSWLGCLVFCGLREWWVYLNCFVV